MIAAFERYDTDMSENFSPREAPKSVLFQDPGRWSPSAASDSDSSSYMSEKEENFDSPSFSALRSPDLTEATSPGIASFKLPPPPPAPPLVGDATPQSKQDRSFNSSHLKEPTPPKFPL